MTNLTLVVPCYNEAKRLNVKAYENFISKHDDVNFIFVDDGSSDKTLEVLEKMQQHSSSRIHILRMPQNQGKAEAVRRGLLEAMQLNHAYVGFLDADLATGFDDILSMRQIFSNAKVMLVLGSRVKLLGRTIERKWWRHYMGRVFATFASLTLRLPVYDTQCGAKLFRVHDDFKHILAEPFQAKWVFDVELLARFTNHRQIHEHTIVEYPLESWRDVAGSKLRPRHFVIALFDLFKIWRRYY